ncbi:P-loop containing nucleoside triphosphate hydrolase protein [Thelephora ganbajun]|uniref:P-loop containing nucleoside triphosphate hydrolase protein n=1 Tax=Thelephora ganbajun TaxID=370292 RepID=A0ACB6YXF2_THEGA|nr:P-loop containing nucleoside triphosphate hydrolase protein [Thelephora ganbajun]
MHLVPTLMEQKVAVIFLTATLPVRLEELFRKAVNLPANHNLIRAQTNRPESVYIVKPFQASPPGEGVEQVGARLAAKLAELLEGEDRAIIFVRKKDHGDEIARRLYGCPFISSDMTDEKARTEAMKQWENGTTGGLLVGTSSLIQGLHYDHVRYVIFVGAPWGLIDLVQGAGRGGRDGKRAEVVVINCFDKSPNDPTPDDPQCEGEMGRWLIAQHCRRELISSTMDAVQVTCQSLEGALPCDNCQSRHPEVDNAWAYATSATTSATSKNTSLSAPPHTLQQQEDTTQLALPTLRPQAPKAQVIDHSVITTADRELLHSRTRSVFNSIVATSPTCAICWFLNLRDVL